ncbi:uncharacterized protein SETTUDRAFT_31889 [Exserohilum turcica Et28A]|uniref:Uncharacterized protein n=1 Tax=Exserohilum turcicum (strain 28A) TaxID=671987 RepID=R0K8R0_EXST2|nr:uncharacterized protein SETTUDRAFT_31889 [Exserohilum turcica Et28A]EOA84632.1 hypothetical protein SETTUDRAFT_31889 [Exserohilum turcica Et28A]
MSGGSCAALTTSGSAAGAGAGAGARWQPAFLAAVAMLRGDGGRPQSQPLRARMPTPTPPHRTSWCRCKCKAPPHLAATAICRHLPSMYSGAGSEPRRHSGAV